MVSEINMTIGQLLTIAAVPPVTIGLVQVLKEAGLPSRFAPITGIAIATLGSFVFPQATPALTIFVGIGMGLMALGLYSGAKAMVKPSEPDPSAE